MHRVPDSNLVFIHIPKTAGQAIRASLNFHNETGAHAVNTAHCRTLLGPEFIRFCVTRDPFDRFVSVWKYNVRRIKPDAHPESLGALLAKHGLDKDVNDFARWLSDRRYDLMRFQHLRPQTYYIDMGRPQIILRQQCLKDDIKILEAILKRNIPMRRRNMSTEDEQALNTKSREWIASAYANDVRSFSE